MTSDDRLRSVGIDPVVDQLALIAKGVQSHSPAIATTCRDAIETITRLRLELSNARKDLEREQQLADRVAAALHRAIDNCNDWSGDDHDTDVVESALGAHRHARQ